ncbi:MAG: hypothetical protein E4H41_06650 [Gemmatimonadales bacterium]|nr:MAG: hypothetical protein E4H41_06650 [Gemmatimonadales bacterium]
MQFPNTIPSLTSNASGADRQVQVAYARAWEALVETHRAEAATFVEALAPLVSVDEALDAYFREVPVPVGMRDAVRTGAFLRIDFSALDAPGTDGTPTGWALLNPGILLGVTRRMASATQEARRRMTLATARALEGLAATHKSNALMLAGTRAGSSEDGVRHYIRTMDLPAHQAQMVYQQALAAMAEVELDAPVAQEESVIASPAPTRIPFLKVWARAS